MNEAVEVKIEEKQAGKKRIGETRNGKAMPLKHTAEINPFFKGVFRRYHIQCLSATQLLENFSGGLPPQAFFRKII